MSISFDQIPSTIRIPFVAVEINSSAAQQGPSVLPLKGLLIGQKTSSGSASDNSLHRISSPDDAVTLAGRGSMLHRMAMGWYKQNKVNELWIGVLADNGTGVQASGTITVSGPATGSGTLNLYLGGDLVQVGVTSGDSASAIATAIAAAITAAADLPVTASPSSAVVTVTFRHKGLVGNSFDMRVNYADGEKYPAGVSLAFVQLASGTSNPVLTTLIAALGDLWFHVWAHPYTDSTSLTALETELTRRFGPMTMIDGVAYTAAVGSVATLATLGESRNSPHNSIMSSPGESPLTPIYEVAASVAGAVALSAQNDPAQPMHTIQLVGMKQPAQSDLFTDSERNLLLYDGIGTTKAGPGGVVQIERPITTYQLSAAGSPDEAYLDSTTLFNLMYLRYDFRTLIATKYARYKLADDGTEIAPGQKIITPKIAKAEAIAWFRAKMLQGLVQNLDQFKRDLVVVRNGPTRLEFLLPPTLIGQLIVGAAQIQFRLS